jgi:predicted glycosyltransferase
VVVDVSVEMALLVRLMGVAPIWIAQRGVRDDLPHQLAYAAAQTIIAPWTEATQLPGAPGAPPRERTTLVGALSRFDNRPAPAAVTQPSVCVLLGFGGHEIAAADIAAAARATPDWRWDVTGVPAAANAPNVCIHPPDCDVWALLARATVAVATASTNAVGEVAAARRPLICLPQQRPFDEQRDQAEALQRAGLATVLERWPSAERWPALLDAAARRDPDVWGLLHDRGGAERFARAIEATACV